MADKKFSELDPVGSLTGTEILPVIKEGLPKRTTVADVVANYVLKTGDTMTGSLTATTLTAGTATDALGTALSVIRNNVAVGRIDNNASGLRVQAQNGSLQLRGTGNTGIAIDDSGNAVVAGTITGANLSGTNTGDQPLGSRTITGTTNQVTVTNGNGVSGNPTLSLPSAITTPGSLTITGNNSPQADSTYTLGTSSLYWSNTYTDRLYLNSTAYLDGATAGIIGVTGGLIINGQTEIGGGLVVLLEPESATKTWSIINKASLSLYTNSSDNYTRYLDIASIGDQVADAGGGAIRFVTNPFGSNIGVARMFISQNGNVGVGTTSPVSRLTVTGGDAEITDTTKGVILKSPDGTRYRITVANGGTLTITAA